jgi:enoyl-CoA hydratase/carnithine racemase
MSDYSKYETIKVETANRVATVTLNRPDSLNAVNPVLHRELCTIWLDLAVDEEVNAIILTGAGRAFCAGGDVKGMANRAGTSDAKERTLRTPAEARRIVENMLDVEQPIIGAINGDAIGLGATIALLTDITVVSEKARFADTMCALGLSPATAAP